MPALQPRRCRRSGRLALVLTAVLLGPPASLAVVPAAPAHAKRGKVVKNAFKSFGRAVKGAAKTSARKVKGAFKGGGKKGK